MASSISLLGWPNLLKTTCHPPKDARRTQVLLHLAGRVTVQIHPSARKKICSSGGTAPSSNSFMLRACASANLPALILPTSSKENAFSAYVARASRNASFRRAHRQKIRSPRQRQLGPAPALAASCFRDASPRRWRRSSRHSRTPRPPIPLHHPEVHPRFHSAAHGNLRQDAPPRLGFVRALGKTFFPVSSTLDCDVVVQRENTYPR